MLKTGVLSSRQIEEILRKTDSVTGIVMKVHKIEATINKPTEKKIIWSYCSVNHIWGKGKYISTAIFKVLQMR